MINRRLLFRTINVCVGVAAFSFCGSSFLAHARSHNSQQQPDNTSTNKQDSQQGAMTADQQNETPADRELAKKIRKSIVSDKSLSTYAHNVKVIVRDGRVTLKGPVQSDEEKKSIGSKAADLAGRDRVQNELTVKS
jgi:hyperosmotically inducible periplasmic protein